MSTAIEESLRAEVERLSKERDAAVAERWTALEQARELRSERWSAQEQVRELLAEVERRRHWQESVSVMLGWLNVPPQGTIEAHLRALRARADGTESELASARAEVERLETEMRERLSFTLDDGQAKIHGKPKDLLAVVELREQAERQKALLTECLALLEREIRWLDSGFVRGPSSAEIQSVVEKLRAALVQQQKGVPE